MRSKKYFYNSVTSLICQLVTMICGFILPRFMLTSFGSEINGAVTSISQFLGYISLLEAGVGGVTRAALYGPIAKGDSFQINGIINATQRFFRKIALLFLLYSLVLSCSFKSISNTELSWSFVALLVAVLSVGTFSQYYFGITYSILLNADQSSYIINGLQILTVILNTVVSIFLLKLECNVHIVKLASVAIYAIRPIVLNIIGKHKFNIDKTIPADNLSIRRRWNGLGHHIAYYVHNNVDVMVITIFLGLKYSSVYSIYGMILFGIKNVVMTLSNSAEAALGDIIARDEESVLKNRFALVETLTSLASVVLFTTAGLLIFDFIEIYTMGVNDINYKIIPFGIIFAISEALHAIKQNYHSLIMAAGHYKETQLGAFIEAGLNLVLSLVLATCWGLVGIVLATAISTLYRTIEYVIYLRKNIIHRSACVFVKRIAVNMICSIISIIVSMAMPFSITNNYFEWILKAIPVFAITAIVTFGINFIVYKNDMNQIVSKIVSIIGFKRGDAK